MFAPPPNFKTMIGNFKVEREMKLWIEASNLLWDLNFKVCLFSKFYCYWLVYKANHQVCKKVSRKIEKIFWSSRLEFQFQSFVLNFEVSDQSFQVMRARMNRFDWKWGAHMNRFEWKWELQCCPLSLFRDLACSLVLLTIVQKNTKS